ncbi:putative plastid-lipid-associated protein 3 chloroplastic [Bienertia sinuspersici]
MSLLTSPPSSSFFFLKTQNLHHPNHNHNSYSLSSFSLLPSPTPLLSLSSTRPSCSRTFSSRSSSNSSDDEDEWGKEPKSKSNQSSFTIGTPEANISFNIPDEWGEKPGPESEPGTEPEPEPESAPDPPKSKSKSKSKPQSNSSSFTVGTPEANISINVPDEWGEKPGSEPEPEPESRFTMPDLPIREDEDAWGPSTVIDGMQSVVDTIDGTSKKENKNLELKRCLLDSVYGSELGFRASAEVRAEISELVSQLEASNPSPNPTEVPGLLDGNWVLVGDEWMLWGGDEWVSLRGVVSGVVVAGEAVGVVRRWWSSGCVVGLWVWVRGWVYGCVGRWSEVGWVVVRRVVVMEGGVKVVVEEGDTISVPGILGSTPLLKLEQISQSINSANQIVENSTTLSSPFATFSFSATASFDVRSSSRIQVRFKEATFKPPEFKSRFDLPANIQVFGQTVTLSPVQQLLNPVQEAAASISRALYGLPPLKIPIPGERTESWLLFTYVDEDFRISRGDGGIFVLVREGSPLLDQ